MAVSSLFCVGLIGVVVVDFHELDDVLDDRNGGDGVAEIGTLGVMTYGMKRCHAEKCHKRAIRLALPKIVSYPRRQEG